MINEMSPNYAPIHVTFTHILLFFRYITNVLNSRTAGEVFLQDGPCYGMAYDMAMCHVCKYSSKEEREAVLRHGRFEDEDSELNCCFYSFRKLKMRSSTQHVTVVGYLDPHKDVREGTVTTNDLAIWRPTASKAATSDDADKAKFILGLIGDQFCDMVLQEQKCVRLNREQADNKLVVWKRAVKGVREMCDVCATTLFNYHWTCGRCGVFACLDCYKFRHGGLVKDQPPADNSFLVDEYNWPLCTNREEHRLEKLLLAQIIPKNALLDLANKMHQVRAKWKLPQACHKLGESITASSGLGQPSSDFKVGTKTKSTLRPILLTFVDEK